MVQQSEALSRVSIDKALTYSGRNLLDPHQVKFEMNIAAGGVVYLLGEQRCHTATKIHGLETRQATSRARLGDLFQSMLHRAFNNELN